MLKSWCRIYFSGGSRILERGFQGSEQSMTEKVITSSKQ